MASCPLQSTKLERNGARAWYWLQTNFGNAAVRSAGKKRSSMVRSLSRFLSFVAVPFTRSGVLSTYDFVDFRRLAI